MLDAELLQVLNQIPGAIEKAFMAFIEKHPGHGNQKTHGNRFGAGQAKESLRRLKDDKGARESYKQQHRERSANDLSKMSKLELNKRFGQAKTANQRAGIANEMFGRGDWKDSSVASNKTQIPEVRPDELSPRVIGSRGKLAVFLDDNGTYGVAPVVLADNDYFTGAMGKVRRVKPEFVESKPRVKPKGDSAQSTDAIRKEFEGLKNRFMSYKFNRTSPEMNRLVELEKELMRRKEL